MSRLVESNERGRRAIRTMAPEQARACLLAVHDLLWPPADPGAVEWTSETIDEVADVVRRFVTEAL